MRVNGGDVLIKTLKSFGITTGFVLHGGHLDSIFQAAHEQGFKIVDVRHEAAAGHAACGYARSTGGVGVAMVTAGCGLTNVVSPVLNAYMDCVPLIVIGGAAPLREEEELPLQGNFDQMSILAGITKWSKQIKFIERLPDMVDQAIRIARSGRPGPVYLELAMDVAFSVIDEKELAYPSPDASMSPPAPSPEAVKNTLRVLREASRPVIMAGGGVLYSRSHDLLRQFAELTGIPVFTGVKARGALPMDHPLWFRAFNTLPRAAATAGKTDAVLMLGQRLGFRTGGRRQSMLPAEATVIQVDIEPEEIGRNRDIEFGVAADCGQMLQALIEAAKADKWPDRSAWVSGLRAVSNTDPKLVETAMKQEKPVHQYRLVKELAETIPPDSIIALDGGETPAWLDMTALSASPNHWLSHGWMASLGTGVGVSIGAQVAYPDKRVICFLGDGSAGYNIGEFDTMVRHNLPIVVVVNNDQLWGMSAHGQDIMFGPGKRMVSELGPVRYDLAAKGFGCHAEFVERAEDLKPALERALASGKPACVNVLTDPTVIHPITIAIFGALPGPSKEEPEKDAKKTDENIVVPYSGELGVKK